MTVRHRNPQNSQDKSREWLRSRGVQFPKENTISGYTNNLLTDEDIVNNQYVSKVVDNSGNPKLFLKNEATGNTLNQMSFYTEGGDGQNRVFLVAKLPYQTAKPVSFAQAKTPSFQQMLQRGGYDSAYVRGENGETMLVVLSDKQALPAQDDSNKGASYSLQEDNPDYAPRSSTALSKSSTIRCRTGCPLRIFGTSL